MFTSADRLSAPPITDPTLAGAKLLFAQVICQAVEDHRVPTWRSEVDAFFSGPAFARYCALLGWNDDWARQRVQALLAAVTAGSRELEEPDPIRLLTSR